MSQYFTKITDDWRQLKNRLQREALEKVEEYDRLIISSEKIARECADALVDYINKDLLEKHPRCKSLHAYVSSTTVERNGQEDFFLSVPGVCKLNFYQVKS